MLKFVAGFVLGWVVAMTVAFYEPRRPADDDWEFFTEEDAAFLKEQMRRL